MKLTLNRVACIVTKSQHLSRRAGFLFVSETLHNICLPKYVCSSKLQKFLYTYIFMFILLLLCLTFPPFQVLRRVEGNEIIQRSCSKFCHLNWINSLTRSLKIKQTETRRIVGHWKPIKKFFFFFPHINTSNSRLLLKNNKVLGIPWWSSG